MTVLTETKYNEIKAKVKSEMQRRDAPEHGASLAGYAGTEWDFSTPPKEGAAITDEHIQKIIDPLLQVNDFLYDNSLRDGKSGLEITLDQAEAFVDKLAGIDKEAQETGCRGNCTGLCRDACFGGCQNGCLNECGNGCRNGCIHTCGSGCTTSLKY